MKNLWTHIRKDKTVKKIRKNQSRKKWINILKQKQKSIKNVWAKIEVHTIDCIINILIHSDLKKTKR